MKVIVTESQLRKILNEQQTKTVKGVEYWRKSEGEPWQAIDKCVKGNCHQGEGETIGEDGSFIGEFKNGERYRGVLTGPNGDQIYVNGKAEVLREPEEPYGGFISTVLYSLRPQAFDLLPVNAQAWLKDLVGIKKTITSKDFSVDDLLVLIEIVKRVKKEGRIAITPADYKLDNYNPGELLRYDRSTPMTSFEDSLKGSLYRIRTTLGHARIGTDSEGNTIISDTFDFNDAMKKDNWLSKNKPDKYKKVVQRKKDRVIQHILNHPTDFSYKKLRQISGAFGSADGEGANVYINLGDEADI